MGYGDEIMVTGFARLAKQKYPHLQVIIGDKKSGKLYDSVIFKNNPNITKASDLDLSINKVWIENYFGNRPYVKDVDKERIHWNFNYRPVRGDLYFNDDEMNSAIFSFKKINEEWNLKFGNKMKKIIFIEPSRKNKKYDLDNSRLGGLNKDWGYENWQKLINSFQNEILFIQSVYEGGRSFDGPYEYKSDFRHACAMMSLCDSFVGFEGGFSHAAAALKKKAVVIFGGWIHPKITGYDFHENLYADIEGSPCGMKKYCEHCNKCRKLIKVETVKEKIQKILSLI